MKIQDYPPDSMRMKFHFFIVYSMKLTELSLQTLPQIYLKRKLPERCCIYRHITSKSTTLPKSGS